MLRATLIAVAISLVTGSLPAYAKDCNAICASRCSSGMAYAGGGCTYRCMSVCQSKSK
jgi:hypothetical protein